MSEIIVVGGQAPPQSSESDSERSEMMAQLAELNAEEQRQSQQNKIMVGIIVAVAGAAAVYFIWQRGKEQKKDGGKVQGLLPHQAPMMPPRNAPPGAWNAPPQPQQWQPGMPYPAHY